MPIRTVPARRVLRRSPVTPMVGNWAVTCELHSGLYSQVYQVSAGDSEQGGGGDYVLKAASLLPRQGDLARQLVRREANLLRGLNHPHLVALVDASLEQDPPFFVMPHVGRSTLADAIDSPRQLPLREVCWVARQLAVGLHRLHQHGWCHLDVKPSNAVVTGGGHVTLIDLAFAQPLGTPVRSLPGLGTRGFLSPECRQADFRLTPACDWYALGRVIWELLIGPLDSAGRGELLPGELDRLATLRPGLPLRLKRLLHRMLATIPERRPTGDELVDLLYSLEIECF